MSDDVDPAAPPARSRVRTVIATVLGVLTVLVLVVTVVAVWAKATVLRSEPVAELVGDAIAEPDVQVALSAYLADQVAASVDLDTRLIDLLPDSLDRFAVPIAVRGQRCRRAGAWTGARHREGAGRDHDAGRTGPPPGHAGVGGRRAGRRRQRERRRGVDQPVAAGRPRSHRPAVSRPAR